MQDAIRGISMSRRKREERASWSCTLPCCQNEKFTAKYAEPFGTYFTIF